MSKVKKFKRKSHKGTRKRIKVTKGKKSPFDGSLLVGRIGDNHRNIGKSRKRLLKAKKNTKLQKMFDKLRRVL